LASDERGVGPLTERLVSALLPLKNEKPGDGSKDDGPSIKQPKQPPLPTIDIEERLKGELQMTGVVVEDGVSAIYQHDL
jgi:hypothetical protein